MSPLSCYILFLVMDSFFSCATLMPSLGDMSLTIHVMAVTAMCYVDLKVSIATKSNCYCYILMPTVLMFITHNANV